MDLHLQGHTRMVPLPARPRFSAEPPSISRSQFEEAIKKLPLGNAFLGRTYPRGSEQETLPNGAHINYRLSTLDGKDFKLTLEYQAKGINISRSLFIACSGNASDPLKYWLSNFNDASPTPGGVKKALAHLRHTPLPDPQQTWNKFFFDKVGEQVYQLLEKTSFQAPLIF